MALSLLETIEFTNSSTNNVTFTGIPQDGLDLLIIVSARATVESYPLGVRFNGSGSNFNTIRLLALGNSFDGGVLNNDFKDTSVVPSTHTANVFSNSSIYISSYASSKNKAFNVDGVTENNASSPSRFSFQSGRWANADPITSLFCYISGGFFAANSKISLYKIS